MKNTITRNTANNAETLKSIFSETEHLKHVNNMLYRVRKNYGCNERTVVLAEFIDNMTDEQKTDIIQETICFALEIASNPEKVGKMLDKRNISAMDIWHFVYIVMTRTVYKSYYSTIKRGQLEKVDASANNNKFDFIIAKQDLLTACKDETDKQIIAALYYGYSQRETAKRLNIALSTLQYRVQRIKERYNNMYK